MTASGFHNRQIIRCKKNEIQAVVANKSKMITNIFIFNLLYVTMMNKYLNYNGNSHLSRVSFEVLAGRKFSKNVSVLSQYSHIQRLAIMFNYHLDLDIISLYFKIQKLYNFWDTFNGNVYVHIQIQDICMYLSRIQFFFF